MEGVQLHPTLGADGVHLFDPGEVDDVASGRRGPSPHRIADLTVRGLVTDGVDPTDAEIRVAELESELARERTAYAAALAEVQQEAREKEQQAAVEAHELAALLDSITDRDLAALDEDDLAELAALLDALEG
jgi:regulator of protease activity HflC (stomatin/prohibitin superfamily)